MADTDTVTLADIIEKLGHLNYSAKRVFGTVYYDGLHAQINDTLDVYEIAHALEESRG